MERKRRTLCILLSVLAVIIIIIVAVVLGVTLKRDQDPDDIKTIFLERCGKFEEYDCQNLWSIFTQAYVNKDPCNVTTEAYDPFIAAAPFKPPCNRMMFWSKTRDVVHTFSEKRDCFVTMEDTLLGSVLDTLTWCGKEGSTETFTTGCPGWSDCENNPVRSFWNSASAAFAEMACGEVTAMLNGSIDTPYSPTRGVLSFLVNKFLPQFVAGLKRIFENSTQATVFATIEVKGLNSTKVPSLTVILVIQKDAVTNCTNPSLEDLKNDLGEIQYKCKEVPESQILECASNPEKPCGSCW